MTVSKDKGHQEDHAGLQLVTDDVSIGIGGNQTVGSFSPMGNTSAQVSVAGVGNTNDTAEDVLFTYTLPAGALAAAGQGVIVEAFGSTANNGSTHTIRVYFGATSFTVTGGTNQKWNASLQVYRVGATTQVGFAQADAGNTRQTTATLAPTETLSGPIVIKVTGQTSVAAANDVIANGFVVTVMN